VWYALCPYIEQTIFIPLNLPEGRAGETWEPSTKLILFPSPGWGLSLSLSLSLSFSLSGSLKVKAMKHPSDPIGNRTRYLWLLAQCLNQRHHHVFRF
jgi:hypothetical protein